MSGPQTEKRVDRTEFLLEGQRRTSWASAHRGRWGQLTPLEKWMKNYKAKNAKKRSFLCLCYIFFASGDKGALTPLTKILRTFLADMAADDHS